jgi:hypothetical protein
MARVSITEENRTSESSFPRLTLEKGETTRVLVLEDPVRVFVHELRRPRIVNDVPEYRQGERRDGTSFTAPQMDFVGGHLCIGDEGVVLAQSLDPDNCLECRAARENPDFFAPPQAKYAMNVLRYATRSDGTMVVPFSVRVEAWRFSGRVFDKLVDLKKTWGDLRAHDLILKCSTKPAEAQYQRPYSMGEFDIAPDAWALASEANKAAALAMWNGEGNRATDAQLTALCGKQVKPEWMSDDILRVRQGWAKLREFEARRDGTQQTAGFGQESLAAGMAGLQQFPGQQAAQPPAQQPAPQPAAQPGLDFSGLGQATQAAGPPSQAAPGGLPQSQADPFAALQPHQAPQAAQQPAQAPSQTADPLAGLAEFAGQQPAQAQPAAAAPPAQAAPSADPFGGLMPTPAAAAPANGAPQPGGTFDFNEILGSNQPAS